MKVGRKLIILCLILLQTLSLCGCGVSGIRPESSEAVQADPADKNEIVFPLKEEMTFNLMVRYDGDLESMLSRCAFWQRMYEMTNVRINFVVLPSDGTMFAMNSLFASGSEGDAILGGSMINESDLSLMAANGMLMPMNEYIDDPAIMPNFNSRVLSESPETRGYITMPDGNIYSLPKYTALEGNYLESPLWINKQWLNQLGMSVPRTLEELETALQAFRDHDMNNNGDASDEIPYIFLNGHDYSHLEAILGLWGIPTKDNEKDSYVYLENGKVIFAPTTPAYKDAISTLSRWYQSGLIWADCFTGTEETFNSKFSGSCRLVGMFATKNLPAGYEEDYVRLEPVSVEGYEAKWYCHPGRLGGKGQFSLTRSCKNPEVLMHWIDLFYTLESTVSINIGEEEDGRWKQCEDGKLEFITLSQEETEELKVSAPLFYQLFTNVPGAFTATDYSERIKLSAIQAIYQESYVAYKEYITDEIWPRPYISESDVYRLAELRTDIFSIISDKKANWIMGTADINSEWNDYLKTLEKMGIDELIQILQRNYDFYLSG